MKIIFCGGGTSGHINPALAIAEKIKNKLPNTEILFIGRDGGFENRAVKRAAIPLITLKIEGIPRKISLKTFKNIKLALDAKKEAAEIIKDFSPDAVVGTGGYVCWPVIKAANELNIPTLIHESNVYPGLVTKLLSPRCHKTLLNYEETKKHLKYKSCSVVGNPIRSDFSNLSRSHARSSLGLKENDIFILSFGGSGGAERLNEVLVSLMQKSIKNTNGVFHIHATGNKYYDRYKSIDLKESNERCKILPFIDDMPKFMAAADIVIARSGAATISEIALVGASSILIPSPHVTNNHQYKNAKLLSDSSSCILIEESDLTEELLRGKIELLLKDRELRKSIGKRVKAFANPRAGEQAASEIVELCTK